MALRGNIGFGKTLTSTATCVSPHLGLIPYYTVCGDLGMSQLPRHNYFLLLLSFLAPRLSQTQVYRGNLEVVDGKCRAQLSVFYSHLFGQVHRNAYFRTASHSSVCTMPSGTALQEIDMMSSVCACLCPAPTSRQRHRATNPMKSFCWGQHPFSVIRPWIAGAHWQADLRGPHCQTESKHSTCIYLRLQV